MGHTRVGGEEEEEGEEDKRAIAPLKGAKLKVLLFLRRIWYLKSLKTHHHFLNETSKLDFLEYKTTFFFQNFTLARAWKIFFFQNFARASHWNILGMPMSRFMTIVRWAGEGGGSIKSVPETSKTIKFTSEEDKYKEAIVTR